MKIPGMLCTLRPAATAPVLGSRGTATPSDVSEFSPTARHCVPERQLTAESDAVPGMVRTACPVETAPEAGVSGAAAPMAPDEPVVKMMPTPTHWEFEGQATPLNAPIPSTFWTVAPDRGQPGQKAGGRHDQQRDD